LLPRPAPSDGQPQQLDAANVTRCEEGSGVGVETKPRYGALAPVYVCKCVDCALFCQGLTRHVENPDHSVALPQHELRLVGRKGDCGHFLIAELLVGEELTLFTQVVLCEVAWLGVEAEDLVGVGADLHEVAACTRPMRLDERLAWRHQAVVHVYYLILQTRACHYRISVQESEVVDFDIGEFCVIERGEQRLYLARCLQVKVHQEEVTARVEGTELVTVGVELNPLDG